MLHNPRTRIVYDDARHYLLTTTDTFDIIASDPLDVFVKGTAALYSQEYFEAVKRHLRPGGIFTLYVPLYETDMRDHQERAGHFFRRFPGRHHLGQHHRSAAATTWSSWARRSRFTSIWTKLNQRFYQPDYAPVAQSLREIGVDSPARPFWPTMPAEVRPGPWLAGADLNRDGDLRLQYLAGWGINSSLEDVIYRQMMSYRHPPDGLFTGSAERLQALFAAIGTP